MKCNREEQRAQMAFFEWCAWKGKEQGYEALQWAFHVPNGGARSKIEAGILKSMGVKRGVPDVFVPAVRLQDREDCKVISRHGLFLEFKSKNGAMRPEQADYFKHLESIGYCAAVVHSSGEAIERTEAYLKGRFYERV